MARARPGQHAEPEGGLNAGCFECRTRLLPLRQAETEARSSALIRGKPYPAAMSLDDRLTDRQAHPHPGLFRRHEGLEQAAGYIFGQTGTVIRNRTFHEISLGGRRRNDQHRSCRCMHRLDGIADEIYEHLLDLNLVDRDSSQRRIEFEIDFDISLSGADQAESNRLLHDFVEAFARAHGLPLLDEIAQAPDDLAGASRLRVRLTHH